MGVLGDYDSPVPDDRHAVRRDDRERARRLAKDSSSIAGLRATLWCIHDETALAEAEIEYADRESPSIYVRFRATERSAPICCGVSACRCRGCRGSFRSSSGRRRRGRCRATLRSRCAPTRSTASIAAATNCSSSRRARSGSRAEGRARSRLARRGGRGAELVGAFVRHPFLDRRSEVVSADYVELETGTGLVHTAPGHGAEDFETGVRFGLADRQPGRWQRAFHRARRRLRRPADLRRESADHRRPARSGALLAEEDVAAFLSALLALQESRDLPRDRAVVHRDGRQPSARARPKRTSRRSA